VGGVLNTIAHVVNLKRKEIRAMEDRYLFKAKRLDNEEWVTWNIFSGLYGMDIDKSTICQCTGLKDKNGKLIWENDIVKKEFYTDYDNCANSEEYIGIAKIMDCAWVIETIKGRKCTKTIFDVMSYSEEVKHFAVIGNIFDNPELLESEE
jgi:uncharacterized phage protein (TIGR01671 family)